MTRKEFFSFIDEFNSSAPVSRPAMVARQDRKALRWYMDELQKVLSKEFSELRTAATFSTDHGEWWLREEDGDVIILSTEAWEQLQSILSSPGYSSTDWAVIFYYASQIKAVDGSSITAQIKNFISLHGIGISPKSLRNKFYDIHRRINKTNDYPSLRLREILPFIGNHYPGAVAMVENDITFLEAEATERQ